ncbi:MAG: hypothetical protein U5R06_04375 [candidate division KSB1 bacterium]|nr:hypothetical protein [candidate division KSB1 bacterium]
MQDSVRKIAHCIATLSHYLQRRQGLVKDDDASEYDAKSDRLSESAEKDDGCPESIHALYQRYKGLSDVNSCFETLPRYSCQSYDFFLKDNLDFFIGYLVKSPNDKFSTRQIQAFIKHLNDCYWCFAYYSAFFKYYEIERRAIEERYHTRMNGDEKNGGGHDESL